MSGEGSRSTFISSFLFYSTYGLISAAYWRNAWQSQSVAAITTPGHTLVESDGCLATNGSVANFAKFSGSVSSLT